MVVDRTGFLERDGFFEFGHEVAREGGGGGGVERVDVEALGFPVLVQRDVEAARGGLGGPPTFEGGHFRAAALEEVPVEIDAVEIFAGAADQAGRVEGGGDHPGAMGRQGVGLQEIQENVVVDRVGLQPLRQYVGENIHCNREDDDRKDSLAQKAPAPKLKVTQNEQGNIEQQIERTDIPAGETVKDDADAAEAASGDVKRHQKETVREGSDESANSQNQKARQRAPGSAKIRSLHE